MPQKLAEFFIANNFFYRLSHNYQKCIIVKNNGHIFLKISVLCEGQTKLPFHPFSVDICSLYLLFYIKHQGQLKYNFV